MRFLLQFYGRMSADNFDLFHHDRGAGLIVPVSGSCGDFIHSVHAADNMAKCSILAIQMRSILPYRLFVGLQHITKCSVGNGLDRSDA